ncbi:glycosyltransferase [Variovorax terrae]|uniref:Glycosyltransferase n=1 Tax=Variovorax terrae TaxID=2923278 RepID=A0A9X1VUI9_9BURK|nr:glycosyltransferase [Variovorax terrae]MCJ0763587.1 glycosyltransferase [Variovorax terrae]
MAIASKTPLHLLGKFSSPFIGAERELPDLAQCLAGRRETVLWSDAPPHPAFSAHGVRVIRPFAQDFPKGGMLLMGGVHVPLGIWLHHCRPERVALRYNLPQHERLFSLIEHVRAVTGVEPELLFASQALQLSVGLPGVVEPSLIRLDAFLKTPVERPDRGVFTVGRASRDVPEKHHAEDAALYRMLAAHGVRVRIMGGTCLASQLAGVAGIELLPTGAEEVSSFYRTLDAVLYRTGAFYEPYGRVVFEAMASGLPVVAASTGGYAEFLTQEQDGFLFRTQEEAFNLLMRLAADRPLRERVGHAARQRATALHGAEAIEAMLQFYLT